MKKILGVAAAVALATGAVFAEGEGLKTSVVIQTGLQSNLTEHETYNIRSVGNKNRVNISLNYTGENFGLVTYFRSQWNAKNAVYTNNVSAKGKVTADGTVVAKTNDKGVITGYTFTGKETSITGEDAAVTRSASMPYLRHAYGYANLFGGNVKVDAGLLSVETWGDSYEADSCQQGGGAQLEITPVAVPGLNVGTSFIARNIDKDSSTVNWDKKHWTAGAKYEQPDGKYTAVLGWDGGASNVWDSSDNEFVWAEFSMWEMPFLPALSAGASVTYYNPVVLKSERTGQLAIAYIGFDVSKIAESVPLTINLYGAGKFYQHGEDYRADEKSTKAPKDYSELEFDGYVAYKINEKITAKAEGAYWLSNEDGKDDDDKKQWFGKVGASYKAAKGAELGLYYSHKSHNFSDGTLLGGMEMSAPSATGYDFVSLDFVYNF